MTGLAQIASSQILRLQRLPDVIENEAFDVFSQAIEFGDAPRLHTTQPGELAFGELAGGGDTLFANQVMAWDALSEGLKKMLRDMKAISSSAKADVSKSREDRMANSPGAKANQVFEVAHPVVRTHPETGRKALYINIGHTARFEGWTEEESAPLLNFLHQHQIKAEFTCRFQWRVGSLALWDNRAALHYPINDYHGHRRIMHRITLKGDRPR